MRIIQSTKKTNQLHNLVGSGFLWMATRIKNREYFWQVVFTIRNYDTYTFIGRRRCRGEHTVRLGLNKGCHFDIDYSN